MGRTPLVMRSPHTHTVGEAGGPPNVAETGWGTIRQSQVRVGVTRESAGHGYGDNRRLPMWLDARKSRGCYRREKSKNLEPPRQAWGPPLHFPSSPVPPQR